MTISARILVVDDDAAMREMVASLLEAEGMSVQLAASLKEAVDCASADDFDAVLSDIRMPGGDGLELVGALHAVRPQTPVVLMTAFGSIDSAVEAMRVGAFDYVTKPFKRTALVAALSRALERRTLEEENRRLRRAVDRTSSFGELLGASPQMREIFALIRKLSPSASNVLITGESGTGKEIVARTLHYTGLRKDRPFVPINCTAMPEGLLESELFGHVRGAFTGAHTAKKGLFEEAHGGTLFLDEIGDMALGLQSKLLRVLQDREVRPVGGNRSVRVDVRIIAATNKALKEEIEAGRFRQDLFYRLNVIPIHIPPLRERPQDIELLSEHFVRKHSPERPRRISARALERLCHMPWEGNARELENAIERALVMAPGDEISPDDLPPLEARGAGERGFEESLLRVAVDKRMTLRELGDRYIEEILGLTGGNKLQAARILGINRRTLYRRETGGAEPIDPEPIDAGAELTDDTGGGE
jgi:DNA-binding NtrC family response regulator